MIERYGPPSKMDTAPYKTLCKVPKSQDIVEIYIQISHDEEKPNWIPYAEFAQPVSDEHIQLAISKKLLSSQ